MVDLVVSVPKKDVKQWPVCWYLPDREHCTVGRVLVIAFRTVVVFKPGFVNAAVNEVLFLEILREHSIKSDIAFFDI